MPLPFSSSFQRLPKRKFSGSVANLPGLSAAQGGDGNYSLETATAFEDDPTEIAVKTTLDSLTVQKRSMRRGEIDSDAWPTKSGSSALVSATATATATRTSWLWICGVCRTVDVRELAGFVVWEALIVLVVVLAVADWIFLMRFVVAPEDASMRAKYVAAWATFTALLVYARQYIRSLCGAHVRSLADHAEIFVAVSLVMVFSTNVAFYLHAPSAEPLRDLGFMLVPAQSEDSKWRPLSDLMTALLPIFCMVQSFLMTRENRCRVMKTFFRVATVSYALRTLTVSLTSLPGPAPHCRPGSALYLPPESWLDVVTRVGPMYGKFFSCGDLIFSGHMAYTNSSMLLYLRTLDRYFVRFSRLRWLLGGGYLAVLAVLCISGRKHYSVDVVLGFLISTLVFFHFEHSWVPVCLQHPEQYAQLVSRHDSGRRRGGSSASTASGRSKSDMDLYEDSDGELGGEPLKRIVVVDPDDEDTRGGRGGVDGTTAVDFIC